MRAASQEFADDPCSSMKRGAMVRAARGLLSSVTRLLILADMVDIHLLLKSLHVVSSLSVMLGIYNWAVPHAVNHMHDSCFPQQVH